MQHPKHRLTVVYYVVLLMAVLAAMGGYYVSVVRGWGVVDEGVSTVVYSVVLLYVLLSLPLSFWLFSVKMKGIRLMEDEGLRYGAYVRWAALRLVVIMVGLVASVFCYYLLRDMSLFWLAGICAIAVIVCKPTEGRIDADLNRE